MPQVGILFRGATPLLFGEGIAVHIQPFLESSCVLGIHISAPAIGGTTSSQRGMEGFQMVGMHLCGGQRLCGVGMLWIRCLIPGPFGTALMPLGPFILEPPFDALRQRLLGASAFASAQGLTTELKQETSIAPLAIGQQRQITRLLDDLTQEPHGFFKHLAVFPSTVHVPQKTGRPIHQHHGPALGRVRGDLLMHSGGQLIAFNELLQKLMRQGEQEEGFFKPLRRSCQR